jgi:hypothetical protein
MSTVKTIEAPPSLAAASGQVLSPDGRTVACRLEGPGSGLYAYEIGGTSRPLRLDEPSRRFVAPAWSARGDLLFRIELEEGGLKVGAIPAPGRGSPVEHEGSGIAVSVDGRVLAVAGAGAEGLRAVAVGPENSPFHQPLRSVGILEEVDPATPLDLEITRDCGYVVLVEKRAGAPSLWAFPLSGGDGQAVVLEMPAGSSLSFALSKDHLAVLEVRGGEQPFSRLYVRPLAAGSLGALRLGPARDLALMRFALPAQRPAFSPDGKKIALVVPSGLAGAPAVELYPVDGNKSERAASAPGLAGSPRFLEGGGLVVDGGARVSLVSL